MLSLKLYALATDVASHSASTIKSITRVAIVLVAVAGLGTSGCGGGGSGDSDPISVGNSTTETTTYDISRVTSLEPGTTQKISLEGVDNHGKAYNGTIQYFIEGPLLFEGQNLICRRKVVTINSVEPEPFVKESKEYYTYSRYLYKIIFSDGLSALPINFVSLPSSVKIGDSFNGHHISYSNGLELFRKWEVVDAGDGNARVTINSLSNDIISEAMSFTVSTKGEISAVNIAMKDFPSLGDTTTFTGGIENANFTPSPPSQEYNATINIIGHTSGTYEIKSMETAAGLAELNKSLAEKNIFYTEEAIILNVNKIIEEIEYFVDDSIRYIKYVNSNEKIDVQTIILMYDSYKNLDIEETREFIEQQYTSKLLPYDQNNSLVLSDAVSRINAIYEDAKIELNSLSDNITP